MDLHVSNEIQYRCALMRRTPLGRDGAIVTLPLAERVCILGKHEVERLSACTEFLTLAEHANDIVRQFCPSSDPREIEAWLRALSAKGALISSSEFLSLCGSLRAGAARSSGLVEWLAIPTRGRPERLLNAARSYMRHFKSYGHRLRIVVCDQTPPRDQFSGTSRTGLGGLSREIGLEVFFAGIEEKLAFARALCSTGSLPREVVQFALFGRPDTDTNIGANRNATLLQTVGGMLITVDDDTLCEPARVPESAPGVRFGGEIDPTEAWFFADRAGAHAFVEQCNVDFVECHREFLGRYLGEISLYSAESRTKALKTVCPHIFEYLCFDRGQVLATYTGVVGDAGISSTFPVLLHPNRGTRDRFRASHEAYVQNTRSSQVVRQALCTSVVHGPGAVGLTMCLGLDNRLILPPFFPAYRGEDGIFGQTLALYREDSCFSHLALTIAHDRPPGRVYGNIPTVHMCDLVQSAIGTCSISPLEQGSPERLERLGRFLITLGSLTEAEFRDWARAAMFMRASNIVQISQAALTQDCDAPKYWAEDIYRIIDRISLAVQDPDYIVPHEVRGGGGLRTARETIRQFGGLLCWWPAIVERTKALAESGVTIASPIP